VIVEVAQPAIDTSAATVPLEVVEVQLLVSLPYTYYTSLGATTVATMQLLASVLRGSLLARLRDANGNGTASALTPFVLSWANCSDLPATLAAADATATPTPSPSPSSGGAPALGPDAGPAMDVAGGSAAGLVAGAGAGGAVAACWCCALCLLAARRRRRKKNIRKREDGPGPQPGVTALLPAAVSTLTLRRVTSAAAAEGAAAAAASPCDGRVSAADSEIAI
jgi:hypothetical protein